MEAAFDLLGCTPRVREFEVLKFPELLLPGTGLRPAGRAVAAGDRLDFRLSEGERVFASGRCRLARRRGRSALKPCLLIPIYDHKDGIGPRAALARAERAPLLGGRRRQQRGDAGGAGCARGPLRLAARSPTASATAGAARRSRPAIGWRWRAGFSHAIQLDADGQHDAGDVKRFLEEIARDPRALILGAPIFDESAPKSRLYGRQLSRAMVWLSTLSFDVTDPLCGFRGIPLAETVALIDSVATGDAMEFDPELVIRLALARAPDPESADAGRLSAGRALAFPHDRGQRAHDLALHAVARRHVACGCRWLLPQRLRRGSREDAAMSEDRWARIAESGTHARAALRRLVPPPLRPGAQRGAALAARRPTSWSAAGRPGSARAAISSGSGPRRRGAGRWAAGPAVPSGAAPPAHLRGRALRPPGGLERRARLAGGPRTTAARRSSGWRGTGRGALLLGAHLGSFDMLCFLSRKYQLVVNVIGFHGNAERINAFLRVRTRPNQRIRMIDMDPNSVSRRLRDQGVHRARRVRGDAGGSRGAGEDRAHGGSHPAGRSPPRVSARSVPAGGRARVSGAVRALCRHRPRALRDPAAADRRRRARAARRAREARRASCSPRYVALLESTCTRLPFQWFNFYDFWGDDAEAAS